MLTSSRSQRSKFMAQCCNVMVTIQEALQTPNSSNQVWLHHFAKLNMQDGLRLRRHRHIGNWVFPPWSVRRNVGHEAIRHRGHGGDLQGDQGFARLPQVGRFGSSPRLALEDCERLRSTILEFHVVLSNMEKAVLSKMEKDAVRSALIHLINWMFSSLKTCLVSSSISLRSIRLPTLQSPNLPTHRHPVQSSGLAYLLRNKRSWEGIVWLSPPGHEQKPTNATSRNCKSKVVAN